MWERKSWIQGGSYRVGTQEREEWQREAWWSQSERERGGRLRRTCQTAGWETSSCHQRKKKTDRERVSRLWRGTTGRHTIKATHVFTHLQYTRTHTHTHTHTKFLVWNRKVWTDSAIEKFYNTELVTAVHASEWLYIQTKFNMSKN